MPLDYQFSGPPSKIALPAQGLGLGADNFNNVLYLVSSSGTKPLTGSVVGKAVALSQSANITTLYSYPVPLAGLYALDGYVVSTVATSGTLVSVTAVSTENDTSGTITSTVVTGGASSAANTIYQGRVVANCQAGSTIVFATTSYATTAYNVKVRVTFLG